MASGKDPVWTYEPSGWVYVVPRRKGHHKPKFKFQLGSQTDDGGLWRWVSAPNPSSSFEGKAPTLAATYQHWWPHATLVPAGASLYRKQWETASALSSVEFLNSNSRKRGGIHIQTTSKQKKISQRLTVHSGAPSRTSPQPNTIWTLHSNILRMPGESHWLKLHSSKYTNCDIGHPAIVRARGMASQACFTRGSKRPAVRAGTDGCRSKMAEIEERQHSKTDRIIIRRTFGVCVVLRCVDGAANPPSPCFPPSGD